MPLSDGVPVPGFLRHIGTSWVVVSESGAAFIVDCGTEDVVRQISHLLADARLGQNQPLPSMCADCFIYRLEISATNGSVIVQADDSNLGESGAAELIDALRQVRDQALSSAS